MATLPVFDSEEYGITATRFCADLSSALNERGMAVPPSHLLEAIGGISNLYLQYLLTFPTISEQKWLTNDSIASELISRASIVDEIGDCVGCSATTAEQIYIAIEDVLRWNFRIRRLTRRGNQLRFFPLGLLEIVDLEGGRFYLTYRDPAADNYSSFLLEHRTAMSQAGSRDIAATTPSWIVEFSGLVLESIKRLKQGLASNQISVVNAVDVSFWSVEGRESAISQILDWFVAILAEILPSSSSVSLRTYPGTRGLDLIATTGTVTDAVVVGLMAALRTKRQSSSESITYADLGETVRNRVSLEVEPGGVLRVVLRFPNLLPVKNYRPGMQL